MKLPFLALKYCQSVKNFLIHIQRRKYHRLTLLKSLEVFVLLLSGKAAVSTLQMHNGIAQGEWFSKMGVDFWHRVIQIPLEILHFCQ